MPNSTPARDDAATTRQKRRWGRWVGLVVVVLLVAVVIGHGIWGASARGELDALLAQLRAAGEPVSPSDLTRQPPLPDARNAAVDLRAAARSVDMASPLWKRFDSLSPALPLTEREAAAIRAVVDAESDALGRLTAAARKPEADWQVQFSSPLINMQYPDLGEQRQLAMLAAAAALLRHGDGDDDAAVRLLREVMFISRSLDGHPTLLGHLVASGVAAMAADRAAAIAPDLSLADGEGAGGRAAGDVRPADRQEVRALIDELLDERGPRDGFRRAWRGERVMMVDAADYIFAGGGGGVSQGLKQYAIKPLVLTDARLLAEYVGHMIAAADAPDLPAYLEALPPVPGELKGESFGHFFAAIMMPSLERAAEVQYRGLTDRRLAAAALAVRCFVVDHGRWPESFEELVPEYLPAVPLDGFAAGGQPIKLARTDAGPVVYSVGPDGDDDGASSERVKRMRDGVPTQDEEDRVVHLTRQPREPEPEDEEDGEGEEEALDGPGPTSDPQPTPEGAGPAEEDVGDGALPDSPEPSRRPTPLRWTAAAPE